MFTKEYLIDIFEEFLKYKNGMVVTGMNYCEHSCSTITGEVSPNQHHLENSVFNHTCLVFNQLLNFVEENITIFDVYVAIAIICHDYGKILTRDIKGNITTFYSHQFASIQFATDFITHLVDNGYYLGVNPYYYVLNSISNHIDFLRSTKDEQFLYANRDPNLLYVNSLLSLCDCTGRIAKDKPEGKQRKEQLLDNIEKSNILRHEQMRSFDQKDVTITFVCGVPAVGKNYIINNMIDNDPYSEIGIVSYDDIRIKLYTRDHNVKNLTDKELYQLAYQYCKDNKIDLNHYLKKEVETFTYRLGYDKVIINNTNTTRKSRKTLINLLGKDKYNFEALYIVGKTEDIFESDINRQDKTVGVEVLSKFMNNQQIPTKKEGFGFVYLEYNER